MNDYTCLKCGGHLIYTCNYGFGIPTLSCFSCGETEDSKHGIAYMGKRIQTSWKSDKRKNARDE
jgi:hypothetical protein